MSVDRIVYIDRKFLQNQDPRYGDKVGGECDGYITSSTVAIQEDPEEPIQIDVLPDPTKCTRCKLSSHCPASVVAEQVE